MNSATNAAPGRGAGERVGADAEPAGVVGTAVVGPQLLLLPEPDVLLEQDTTAPLLFPPAPFRSKCNHRARFTRVKLLADRARSGVRGKDAGSARSRRLRARLRTPHRAAERGRAAQGFALNRARKKKAEGPGRRSGLRALAPGGRWPPLREPGPRGLGAA